MERRRISVSGICQGVGFRPFVYRLAERWDLRGWVRNDSTGVTIEVEGASSALDRFTRALERDAPPLAEVGGIRAEALEPTDEVGFRIESSGRDGGARTLISPDVATCDDCLQELADPADRRYGYPFLNCTHCGPRFTITRQVPYDRPRTTMAGFELCEACRAEYEDPTDRRFHAQPTACPACGPRLRLLDAGGREVAMGEGEGTTDPLAGAVECLRAGATLAVKGLGGYHLACDARSAAAVGRLRERKGRPARPFALMVRDLDAARTLCRVGSAEADVLTSIRRPIVLLRRREGAKLARGVAPGLRHLGLMLPYTPLHHLLMEAFADPLVLTSGNRSEEPIAYRDEEALRRLEGLVDGFLAHDRPIHVPCDDSVVRVVAGGVQPVRRSRGWAPRPVRVGRPAPLPVLAVGGHLKNTFCLLREDRAFLSQHVGTLESWASYRALRDGIAHFRGLFDVDPTVVAHDLHPDYLSTKLAVEMAGEEALETVAIQHHHAHVAACLAEHREPGPVIGVAFDGTGYGADGAVWGGEFLVAELAGFERRGHLAYRRLPGGDAAVREPWRMALSHLDGASEGAADEIPLRFERELDPARRRPVLQMIRGGAASPLTSSVGRLFDGAAALVGLRSVADFEAQAAMELEAAADPGEEGSYPAALIDGGEGEPWRWDPGPLVLALADDVAAGIPPCTTSARFHNAVRDAVRAGCGRIREETGLETVALTGGVFQNVLLTERTAASLEEEGFRVLLHRAVPPNDGGLALGQAAAAAARARRGAERGPGARPGEERKTHAAGLDLAGARSSTTTLETTTRVER